MPVDRELPSDEARELLSLVRDLAATELAPRAAEFEERAEFPRDVFRILGRAGLLGLAYDEDLGGGGQPYVVYLQVLEELASAWAAVALGVSVHTLSCHPLAMFGTDEQKKRWLPDMLGGELVGAYCLSEAGAGSDAGSLQARARRDGDRYVLDGTKAWVTHGGVADYYDVFCRTSDDKRRGISMVLADAQTPGLLPQSPEKKMGLRSSPTAQIVLDGAQVDADRLIGEEGDGLRIALSALDGGRLGISAVATGVAQAALDAASAYARERKQFGQRIVDFQGVSFMLADMAMKTEAARALIYTAAAMSERMDPQLTFMSAAAKCFASDVAMEVTTNGVQLLGGYGYTRDYPLERMMRDAKITQIYEGTNQIQRLVMARNLFKANPVR
jgi:alkylation response protein AidB-like acyl-CoA dehydrogenase